MKRFEHDERCERDFMRKIQNLKIYKIGIQKDISTDRRHWSMPNFLLDKVDFLG